ERRRRALGEALDEVKKKGVVAAPDTMGGVWQPYRGGWDKDVPEVETAVPEGQLITLSEKINRIPEGFAAHRKIAQLLRQRHERLSSGQEFDWGTAELIAYGTLLAEGT